MASPQQRYHFRKERVRNKVIGTSERPRLSVYRSLKHIYAQAIDDANGKTVASACTLEKDIVKKSKACGNVKSAEAAGKLIAKRCLEKNVKKVVFDRGGRIYHGVLKAVADAAREGGLEF